MCAEVRLIQFIVIRLCLLYLLFYVKKKKKNPDHQLWSLQFFQITSTPAAVNLSSFTAAARKRLKLSPISSRVLTIEFIAKHPLDQTQTPAAHFYISWRRKGLKSLRRLLMLCNLSRWPSSAVGWRAHGKALHEKQPCLKDNRQQRAWNEN